MASPLTHLLESSSWPTLTSRYNLPWMELLVCLEVVWCSGKLFALVCYLVVFCLWGWSQRENCVQYRLSPCIRRRITQAALTKYQPRFCAYLSILTAWFLRNSMCASLVLCLLWYWCVGCTADPKEGQDLLCEWRKCQELGQAHDNVNICPLLSVVSTLRTNFLR